MNKKYRVRLTNEEREHLEKLVRKGKTHARKLSYAPILLKADMRMDPPLGPTNGSPPMPSR